ncbi:MAG: hypothetical protein IJX31_02095, partial [Clostridia bacterium]|nr:hypothetical protein [Clostridia bacterium]
QMKNSYAPILLTFVQKKGGVTALTLVNDTKNLIFGTVEYCVKTLQGEIVWSKSAQIEIGENDVAQIEVCGEIALPNTYLYAKLGDYTAVYSYDMWHTCKFTSEYTYSVKETEDGLAVTIKANAFVKALTLRLPDNYKYTYSDNYFDMQAGEEKTVYICGDGAKADALEVTDFAKEIAHA